MIVYGLSAKGICLNFSSSFHSISSKTLYKTREAAEAKKSSFIDICCDEDKLSSLERATIKVFIVEYELED